MKIKRIVLIFLYILFACLLVGLLKPNYFINIIIVYIPPTIVTFLRLKSSRKKVFIFSLVSLIVFAPPIELMARSADAWDVQTIFPRLFGTVPIENLVYAFINFIFPLSFYENFVDKDLKSSISKRWKYLVFLYLIFAIGVYIIFYHRPNFLALNYWIIGVGLLIPSIAIYSSNPSLIKKTVLPTVFFGTVFFIHEIVSMEIGHWWWPGEYLVPIEISGNVFPLDDVIIWYFLSTPMLIGGYEFFMDDNK